ncbi:hypothetical protein LMG7974_00233 [Campylobacter majalis]|uniref:Uncharacterized protein n=1 Tax=Campylobacter majalis TaxID=2790656 RepID=A0ABM8Q3H1_9BACT|nr:hypothetical protein [Campylobacter majalis]CAD7287312.1 hypothetical protein LMG7974_00233 [Campylobacter majalis]
MILYDKNYNLIGIGKKVLKILGYKNFEEFTSFHNDIDDVTISYSGKDSGTKLIQSVLNGKISGEMVKIKTKENKTLIVIAKALQIQKKFDDVFYELDLNIQDAIDNNLTKSVSLPELRLPILQGIKQKQIQNVTRSNQLNYEVLEKAKNLLGLEMKEYKEYVEIFLQGCKKAEISMQNAIITNNIQAIKNIIAKLKEPAINLHLTPVVKVFNEILNSNSNDINIHLLHTQEILSNLQNTLKRYQDIL